MKKQKDFTQLKISGKKTLKTKKKKFLTGFTVIELLLVIVILALVAALIVIAAKGIRKKARIANILQYSASIKHTLGADIVGEWRFEEGSGSSVADTSDNGNNGTWNGTGSHWAPNPPNKISQLGTAGQFYRAENDYVGIPYSDSLGITKVITIEAWINPNNNLNSQGIVAKGQGSTYDWGLYMTSLRPMGYINDFTYYCWTNNSIKAGDWHHVVFTYDGSSGKLFVNSKKVSRPCDGAPPADISNNIIPLQLGSLTAATTFSFDGYIDEVRIYAEALTSAQIKKLYVEGARKRGLLVKN